MQVQDADVVVASSTGWAHGISTSAGCRKIVYCHNPARWLYQSEEYATGPAGRFLLRAVRPYLQTWDRAAAATADLYLVNSTVVADRVRRAYGIEPEVLHPPVAVDPTAERRPVPGLEPGFWLTIARHRGYKNTRAIVDGTGLMKDARLVVAGADQFDASAPHVTSVGVVPEDQLRWLYANARALVSVSREDFGLTPIEANAFGTPVAVLRAGGFLDSTVEGESGVFIEADTAQAVHDALSVFPEFDKAAVRKNAERFSADGFRSRLREIAGAPHPRGQS
jgi:glycosyltransferase involved in cell wall biosynthesis